MPNYLLAYHGGSIPGTAEEQAQVMAAWGKWFGNLGPATIDGGNPSSLAKTIAADGSIKKGGGPNPVTGYSIIKADNLDAAVALAKGCPIIGAGGGSIEVCEIINMM